jgi:hypothetical protein
MAWEAIAVHNEQDRTSLSVFVEYLQEPDNFQTNPRQCSQTRP